MSWVEDFVGIARQEPDAQPTVGGIKLAVMTGPTTCKVGNLTLNPEDLLFSEHLLKPVCTVVKETAPGGGGLCTDQSTYIPALKSGDQVAVIQISDSKFLVLGRMVSA